jgi:hypothetical protein
MPQCGGGGEDPVPFDNHGAKEFSQNMKRFIGLDTLIPQPLNERIEYMIRPIVVITGI